MVIQIMEGGNEACVQKIGKMYLLFPPRMGLPLKQVGTFYFHSPRKCKRQAPHELRPC
jgi:hypothetical protein